MVVLLWLSCYGCLSMVVAVLAFSVYGCSVMVVLVRVLSASGCPGLGLFDYGCLNRAGRV